MDGEIFPLQTISRNNSAIKECKALGGALVGDGCNTPNYVPDVFFFSCILFTGTYAISVFLKEFKSAPYFPTKVRQIISDFAVVIAIASMTGFDLWYNINTPKLFVPTQFKPTRDDRGWLIPFFHEKNPIWIIPLACIPACFSTILIFMDQQITAVIINRKEYKLKVSFDHSVSDLFDLVNGCNLIFFIERMWLSLGSVRFVHSDCNLFDHGATLVCCGNRISYDPRQFTQSGIGNISARRESSIFGRFGAKSH